LHGPLWESPEDRAKGYKVSEHGKKLREEQIKHQLIPVYFAHVMPLLVVLVDVWFFSSIQFYPSHVVLILLSGVGYLAYHLIQTFFISDENDEPIYPSHDWH
jgi:hypothetical protein